MRLSIFPERIELARSAAFEFTAKVFDAAVRVLQCSNIQWSATGGSIDRAGRFTAGSQLGEFAVEAGVEGLRARSAVFVAEAPAPPPPSPPPAHQLPKRFHGSVALDSERVGRDAGRIAEEVISHLTGQAGAKVVVTLEIQAELPAGAPDALVRTVTENCRTLKFSNQGFEKE